MNALPNPELRHVYRLDADLDAPVDLGDTPHGHRRIIPLTRGTQRAPTSMPSCWRPAAPTGRSCGRPAARSPTSATPSRPTAGRCSTSSRTACAMASQTCSPAWPPARTSTPPSTRSDHGHHRDLRPRTGVGQRRRLHRRGRTPAQRRLVRRLPGGVAMTLAASALLGNNRDGRRPSTAAPAKRALATARGATPPGEGAVKRDSCWSSRLFHKPMALVPRNNGLASRRKRTRQDSS